MRQHFELRNTTGRPAVGVRLMFIPSRTSLLGYRMIGLPRGVSALAVNVNPFGAEIMWEPALPDGATAVLSLELLGERLLREHEVWWDEHGPVPAEGEAESQGWKLLVEAGSVWELAENMINQKLLYCNTLPEVVGSKYRHIHEFFCELDLHTNPNLARAAGMSYQEYRELERLITKMTDWLGWRVFRRLEATVTHPGKPAPGLDVWPDRAQIEAISQLQLKIFHKYLDSKQEPGVLDTAAVWKAFAMFANGQLVVDPKVKNEWDAAPLGSALFYFAEFAFMASEAGIDVSDWERVLPALVGIQEIFTHAYRPPDSAPKPWRFEDYHQGNFEPGDSMPDPEVELVRQRYEVISTDMNRLRIEAGLNAARAFPGSLGR